MAQQEGPLQCLYRIPKQTTGSKKSSVTKFDHDARLPSRSIQPGDKRKHPVGQLLAFVRNRQVAPFIHSLDTQLVLHEAKLQTRPQHVLENSGTSGNFWSGLMRGFFVSFANEAGLEQPFQGTGLLGLTEILESNAADPCQYGTTRSGGKRADCPLHPPPPHPRRRCWGRCSPRDGTRARSVRTPLTKRVPRARPKYAEVVAFLE